MPATRDELSNVIRFQLSQLRAKNAHHDFEHLARHFSRLRISERIIPATGPVGAGGDAGRDFETYRSYLASSPIAESTFLANATNQNIVFACSLVQDIPPKIRSDLKTICSGPGSVHAIYFFCEANIPVGVRQKLISACRETYNVELTIFDGTAIAEALIEPDVFWIAQRYLGLSADQYPRLMRSDDIYEKYRKKWLEADDAPISFADFAEIKAGLRLSTRNRKLRQDLLDWTRKMETFRTSSIVELRRPAMYEICVSALRGLDDLTSRRSFVEEYFSHLEDIREIGELRDACVLLSYCSSALVQGHFEFEAAKLHRFATSIVKNLDSQLESDPRTGIRCELLQLRGLVEGTHFRSGITPSINFSAAFGFWKKMLRDVPNAPLFPLESFADLLTAIAPAFDADSSFDSLTQKTDALLEKRSSSWIAAEKCRDRAIAYYDGDKYLAAIRQLHIAKVKWFTAETLRGSLLSMLLIGDSYLRLGLIFPAKYYSMVVAHLAAADVNAEVNYLAAYAMRTHFMACFLGGEWFTCAVAAKHVFGSHIAFDSDPYSFSKHEQLKDVVDALMMVRIITAKVDPQLSAHIERVGESWQISPSLGAEMRAGVEEAVRTWSQSQYASAKQDLFSKLWARPYVDTGRYRTIEWRALGIFWSVQFENDRETVAICEEFLSALQVTLADLANTDLVLLPTRVNVRARVLPQKKCQVGELPSNAEAIWELGFPSEWARSDRAEDEVLPAVLSIASQVLGKCSALSASDFHKRLSNSMKMGLFGKTHVGKSYAQLCLQLIDRDEFERNVRERFLPFYRDDQFDYRESSDLAWPSGSGPGYTRSLAELHIRNRYRRTVPVVRYTFPRLVADEVVGAKLRSLRERGLKDWEILLLVANIATSYRLEQKTGAPLTSKPDVKVYIELMNQAEDLSAAPIPLSLFTDERIELQLSFSVGAIAKTWKLHFHRQTPDIKAMERLLSVRYHSREDDIPHSDIFIELPEIE